MPTSQGIFPWFGGEDPLLWWSPDPRMVLFTCGSPRLALAAQDDPLGRFRVTLDTVLPAGHGRVRGAATRPGRHVDHARDERRVPPALRDWATRIRSKRGTDDALVGGLYGVAIGRMFFGESMFSRVPDASKVALVHWSRSLDAGGSRASTARCRRPPGVARRPGNPARHVSAARPVARAAAWSAVAGGSMRTFEDLGSRLSA